MRTVRFPENDYPGLNGTGIGELYIRRVGSKNSKDWEFHGFAHGVVEVPDGYELKLWLRPQRAFLRYLETFEDKQSGDRREEYFRSLYRGLDSLDANDIQSIQVMTVPTYDNGMEHIGRLTGLRELEFWFSAEPRLSDAGIRHLEKLNSLELLDLSFTEVTDDALSSIAQMEALKSLTLASSMTGKHLVILQCLDIEKLFVGQLSENDVGHKNIGVLHSLKKLVMRDNATDTGLAAITSLSRLKELDIDSSPVTDDGIKHLSQLRELRKLGLRLTKITDNALAYLSVLPRLAEFEVSCTSLTNRAVAELARFPTLRVLTMDHTKVNDEASEYLARMDKLEELSIRPVEPKDIFNAFDFRFTSSDSVTDKGYACLKTMTSLKKLDIDQTAATDQTLEYLREHPNLEVLMAGHDDITDAGLEAISTCPRLKRLQIGNTNITDTGLYALSRCTTLEVLHIQYTSLSDEGIASLNNLTSLRELVLGGNKVTEDCLPQLRQLPNLEELWIEGNMELTDAGLSALASFPSLRRLHLGYGVSAPRGLLGLAESSSLRFIYARRLQRAGYELQNAMPWCLVRI